MFLSTKIFTKKVLFTFSLIVLLCSKSFTQQVIFHESFGTPSARQQTPYAATGPNSFVFGDPTLVYSGGTPPAQAAREIENNHYAVVAPSKIYTSVSDVVPGWNSGWKVWDALEHASDVNASSNSSGVYAAGNANGGIMVVNAGTTPGVLYKRPVLLQRGKYYKLTYWLWVEYATVQLRTNMLDASGNIGLGFNLGTTHSSNSRNWQMQTQYFYLPAAECVNNNYTISLQNNNLDNGGNDFAIDEILLVETTATEAQNVAIVLAPCSDGLGIPTANDDNGSGTTGNTVTINNVLANDVDRNGTTNVPTANVTFRFVVPVGASKNQWAEQVTVPGEGTWTYNNGNVSFAPVSGFTGNPTPIDYTISQSYSYPGAPAGSNPVTVVSAPATITVTYTNSTAPVITTDIQNGLPGQPVTFANILTNDGGGLNPQTHTISFINPHTGVKTTVTGSNSNTSVEVARVVGEGSWSYIPSSGQLTFTPEPGFTATPTPLSYTAAHNSTPNAKSASANVIIQLPDPVTPTDDLKTVPAGYTEVVFDNILNNDKDATGTAAPVPSNVTVNFVKPTTESVITGNTVTVPGQGVWTYEPTTGKTTFVPQSGFTGVPSPLPYTLTSNGVTSPLATIKIYVGPEAKNDELEVASLNTPVTIDILDNDLVTGSPSASKPNPSTVTLVFTEPVTGSNITNTTTNTVIDVPNEGTWEYNKSTGIITFTALPTFSSNPTPLPYTITDQNVADPLRATSSPAYIIITLKHETTPVTFNSFTANKAGKNVLVSWITATETGNKGFYIQRSNNGINWQSIYFVNSLAEGGNSNVTLNYAYTDISPLNSINYYRLQQVDLDGKFTYINIATVQFTANTTVTVWPNPVTNNLAHVSGLKGNETIQVINLTGAIISTQQVTNSIHVINTAGYKSGIYYVRITDKKGGLQTLKLVK